MVRAEDGDDCIESSIELTQCLRSRGIELDVESQSFLVSTVVGLQVSQPRYLCPRARVVILVQDVSVETLTGHRAFGVGGCEIEGAGGAEGRTEAKVLQRLRDYT